MLSWVEHEKSFMISGHGALAQYSADSFKWLNAPRS